MFPVLAIACSVSVGCFVAQAMAPEGPEPPQISEQARKVKDPLQKSKANIVAGAGLYADNCSGCHGAEGMPTRKFANLERQPAMLTQAALKKFTDGDLFWVLQHGAPGGMPSFADDLSDSQRWQCIQFVRRLGKDAPKYTAEFAATHPQKGSR
jgi:mono/diheme cytochrome c family protein